MRGGFKTLIVFVIIIPILFILIIINIQNDKKVNWQYDNQEIVKDLVDNSFTKVKLSHPIVMDNIVSKFRDKYDIVKMHKINKGLDISVSGIRNGKTDIEIYENSDIKLKDIRYFYYDKKSSSISYKIGGRFYHDYRFFYYLDKEKIPSECIDCNLILKDSSLRYVKDFCCVLEGNWVIQ
ncbi:hypothetical protein Fleli_0357 [Bernardetia litoralis DSM 6794]|uniref:Uncharacterized protein n=1 Tax=Bernardetia litoralis (strain ATCC 23117 / DSM 6794 / NBRC 15988 / NCIMB 1366 / Fx l1 / Sio-4) TaxID=880071 RepID=I4AFV2_BERLS|nr:hypothetical protein [Bernardetia litoralis]AFM02837.1 hypothetical protein Fleli_0357 [Bernardetia litoralis DSM 6794]